MTLIPSPAVTMTAMIVPHCSYFPVPAATMKRNHLCTMVSALFAFVSIVCNAVAQESCKQTAIGPANIVAVRDGRTVMLDDGRELRLAGDRSQR
jgi:hypothetical protein